MATKSESDGQIEKLKKALTPSMAKGVILAKTMAKAFAGPLVEIYEGAKELHRNDQSARLMQLVEYLKSDGMGDAPDTTMEDSMFVPAANALLADEEAGKAWAYAGIVASAAAGEIPVKLRIRFLKMVRDLTNDELLSLLEFGGAAADRPISISRQDEEKHGTAVANLARWGILHPRHVTIPVREDRPELLIAYHALRRGKLAAEKVISS